MIHLYVWLRPPIGPPQQVGEILVADPDLRHGGSMRGEFRYTPEYLERPGAFAVDPFHLPLRAEPVSAEDPATGIYAVFDDSLPDAWGRAIMCRRHKLPRHQQRAACLLERLGAEAMGAMAYTSTPKWREETEEADLPELPDLIEAAERYETDPEAPLDELMRLFEAGSSPGGTRPKVLIKVNDAHYLAKFPSVKDTLDMVALEAATLATARDAGINVPDFDTISLGTRSALLVKRFDVTPQGGRNHVLSMKTLLGAQHYYFLGYGDMADVVRRLSDQPGEDLRGLFRQAVFNAMISNTDDHLKNFAMMHSEKGWHLTPAYDLLPDTGNNREHVLHFGAVGTKPSLDALQLLGRVFGISSRTTKATIEEVRQAVHGFPAQCKTHDVPTQNLETLSERMRLME